MPTPNKLDPAEVARRLAAGGRVGAMAADLGVTHATVRYWLDKLRRSAAPRARIDRGRVAALHAERLSSTDIAAALGTCSAVGVRKVLRELGLPAWGKRSVSFKRKQSAAYHARFAALGVPGLVHLHPFAHRRKTAAVCRRYGLPEDLPRAQVRAVVELAAGPADADALADRCGRSQGKRGYNRWNSGAAASGNHLTDLCRRGLLAAGKRPDRPTVYLLTARCLDLLARAKESP